MALSDYAFDLLTLLKKVSRNPEMEDLRSGQLSQQAHTKVFCALCLIFLGIKMRLP